jgi:hypothetical protein
MNNLDDVLSIYNEHFYGVGAWMGAKAADPDPLDVQRNLFNKAKQSTKEGLGKLDALKLSAEDSKDLSQLRKAFKALMDACDAGAEGKYMLMQIKATKAIFFINLYMARKKVTGVRRDG